MRKLEELEMSKLRQNIFETNINNFIKNKYRDVFKYIKIHNQTKLEYQNLLKSISK